MTMTREAQKQFLTQALGPTIVGATFEVYGQPATLPPDHILQEVYSWGYQACTLDDFLNQFGEAIDAAVGGSDLHEALAALDPQGILGWKRFFDLWRAEGII